MVKTGDQRLLFLCKNLKGNNFTGSVPADLIARSNNGSLLLSIDGIGKKQKKRKNKFIIPVVASVIAMAFVLLIALIIRIMINRRRKQPGDTQVAVKMLSPSSIQGYKEFQAEAKLVSRIHHGNLTSLVDYCHECDHMGLIFEYMAKGDLKQHFFR